MSLAGWIENRLEKDSDGVWVRPDARPFAYTDGIESERHLERVFKATTDLSSTSHELTGAIHDWPSEYHLTPARAQLLRGFDYDRSSRVLEVGCGCGAITRFLGETFDHVFAVEGSHARARLARMRTRDLEHVEIVNSPFEELRFARAFDIVFCVGVFEYASMFVAGDDPYARILRYFDELLAPGGALVLAIENKLGLKYFSSSAEDHNGVMFDGIEGYPRFGKKAMTFGRRELRAMLSKHFETVEFLYPWPDYKIPSLVMSESMLQMVDASELIGSFRSRDYGHRRRKPLFCEALAWNELAANGLVPELAHSFLVVATKGPAAGLAFDSLGRLYTGQRRPQFRTVTRFERAANGGVRVSKSRADGAPEYVEGKLIHRECVSDWITGKSLQHTMLRRARNRDRGLGEILEPTRVWFEDLVTAANGGTTVPGDRLDSIWRNCFPSGNRCRYIDCEWTWAGTLPLKLLVARGLYYFAVESRGGPGLNPEIARMRVDELITSSAAIYGLEIDDSVLRDLVRFEAAFLGQVSGGEDRERDVSAVLASKMEATFGSSLDHLSRRGARWLKRRLRS